MKSKNRSEGHLLTLKHKTVRTDIWTKNQRDSSPYFLTASIEVEWKRSVNRPVSSATNYQGELKMWSATLNFEAPLILCIWLNTLPFPNAVIYLFSLYICINNQCLQVGANTASTMYRVTLALFLCHGSKQKRGLLQGHRLSSDPRPCSAVRTKL